MSGLLPIDYLFSGIRCLNLVQKSFEYFNGFRIVMLRPNHPIKFGVYIQTSLKEYEHFVGHIVDTEGSSEWVSYEIPLSLMINNNIQGRMVNCSVSDHFECKGLTLFAECTKQNFREEITHYIKKIDVIHNPEFYLLNNRYKLPVFFKSSQ